MCGLVRRWATQGGDTICQDFRGVHMMCGSALPQIIKSCSFNMCMIKYKVHFIYLLNIKMSRYVIKLSFVIL